MSPSSFVRRALPWAFALLLLAAAAPVVAKEESRIRIDFENVSEGAVPGARGFAQVQLDVRRAVLHVKVDRLAPRTEYLLTMNDELFTAFTTDGKGSANRRFRLRTDAVSGFPMDPRGKLLAVSDGAMDILAGVVSGPLEPARAQVREWTELAPEPEVRGRAFARFWRLPNGNQRFVVMLRGVERDVYAVLQDGAPIGEIETNAAGNGQLDLRVLPPRAQAATGKAKGQGKGGPPFRPLLEDPRGSFLEVLREGVLVFSGPMLAQIPGLNACTPDLEEVDLQGAGGEGVLLFGQGADCGPLMEVEVSGLAAGDYDVDVQGSSVGTLSVDPDGTGQAAFAVALEPGDVVEIVDPGTLEVVLSALVP